MPSAHGSPSSGCGDRDPGAERDGLALLLIALAIALLAALRDFTLPWDGSYRGLMTTLYEDYFVRNHLRYGLAATHWSPAFVIDPDQGTGVWHWHHPPFYPLWLTAFAALLGHREWVLRLAHLLLYLPVFPALWWLLRQIAGARLAGWSVLLFAATPLVGFFGPMVCHDAAVMAGTVTTLALFWRWSMAPSRARWLAVAAAYFVTASLDFLGYFCGAAVFVLAWITPQPRRAALAAVALLPVALASLALVASIYGMFLGGPLGFLASLWNLTQLEQTRAGAITMQGVRWSIEQTMVAYGAWPVLVLAVVGVAMLKGASSLPRARVGVAIFALATTSLLGSAASFRHLVDHPFWAMPAMVGVAAAAAIGPALGHGWLRATDRRRRLAGTALVLGGLAVAVHGPIVVQQRIAEARNETPSFDRALGAVTDLIDGCVAGFTNVAVVSRRYEPGIVFWGEVTSPEMIEFVLEYGRSSGFKGDAAFVIDRATASEPLLARLDRLASPQTRGGIVVYRFRAWP